MQIVSNGDNLHEMSNPVFWKKEKCFEMLSAENFAQSATIKESLEIWSYKTGGLVTGQNRDIFIW